MNRDYEDRYYEDDPRWQDIQHQHQVDVMTSDTCPCRICVHAAGLDRVGATATAGVLRREFCENAEAGRIAGQESGCDQTGGGK